MGVPIPTNCKKVENGPTIVCKEKGRKMVFINSARKQVEKIRVDGCVLRQVLACDFLVIEYSGSEHFIELKGKNVAHALKQLEATIPLLSKNRTDQPNYAWIISSEAPSIQSGFQIQKARFIKAFKVKLIVRTNLGQHTLA